MDSVLRCHELEKRKKPGHGFQSTLLACMSVFLLLEFLLEVTFLYWHLERCGCLCVGIHMSQWPRELGLCCHWAVTQRPSELLPNLAQTSISVTPGSCAGHWWEGFCNWWCWLIPAAKVPVKLESVREDLHSGGLSHGELVDAASLVVAPPPPSLTSYKKCNKKVGI